ncbi:MAG TPA: hypothetical protein RMG48_18450 [Myxococcales bacterium LLY-WYZ-16_1]|nr:hypothetical protein [Myxococcales bacterium LLY-WYZ-16_1]
MVMAAGGNFGRLKGFGLIGVLGLFAACGDTAPAAGGRPAAADGGSVGGDASPDDGGPRDAGPDAGPSKMGPDAAVDMGPPIRRADPFAEDNDRRDTDCDGLSDREEFSTIYPNGRRTDPENPDSDGDGLFDGLELGRVVSVDPECGAIPADRDPGTSTLPVEADSDGDGIADGLEDQNRNGRVDPGELNPRFRDTDADGLDDAVEDANRNGRRDAGELDGASPDTDGDGIFDGVEDRNRDGIFDAGETDPLNGDTDGDGLFDGEEDVNANGVRESFETDPRTPDTDCDGIADRDEVVQGLSPVRADTDGDGLPDGLELGITAPVPGSDCPGLAIDQDPTTTTGVDDRDSDGDGLLDGQEDRNQNGAVDPDETDPNVADSDGDGLSDGDETLAGFDPTDPDDPAADRIPGLRQICADANLKRVRFEEGGPAAWTLAVEQSFSIAAATVQVASSSVAISALDDSQDGIAGFIARLPRFAGPGTATGQADQLDRRVDNALPSGWSRQARVSGRSIRSHDGHETVVSREFALDLGGPSRTPAQVRNELVLAATGLAPGDVSGLPAPSGASHGRWIYMEQVLLRPNEIVVVGALLDRASFVDRTDNRAIVLQDLVNGSALAEYQAPRGKDCDPFLAEGQSVADFIFMADISGSTDDDRGRISNAADLIVSELQTNNVDFRLGVVPHTENAYKFPNNAGDLRGVGFTTDRQLFATYLSDTSGDDGCEFGLDAAFQAVSKALPRSPVGITDPQKLRDGAVLAVVYISDEYAEEITSDDRRCFNYEPTCATGIEDVYSTNDNAICRAEPDSTEQACIDRIVQPYIDQLIDNNGVAFAQVIPVAATPTSCRDYRCGSGGRNEPGRGYREVVDATGGALYSPCSSDPGAALQAIIDAVAGAASQFKLTGSPISSTLRVGVIRVGQGGSGNVEVVPRDRDDGFDYDAASNSVFFRGFTYRPNVNDLVVISYRLWEPEPGPCGPCAPGQVCDESLGVCVCDPLLCSACGDNEVCDGNCDCACTPDCNGNCGPGETCNVQTCQCECAPDCGGACGPGTVCNPTTCSCDCVECGGACVGSLTECNEASCSCACPDDCGGTCSSNASCNESLCECVCEPGCSDACSGNAICDPDADCACVCPEDCGGCVEGASCNPNACACECPAGCDAGCSNNEVCDPAVGCECACPADCGGCGPSETCDPVDCRCIPTI